MKYVIITPAHNEEKYIHYTLDSVVNQTMKPVQWIIVDDGSTDETAEIVEEYTKKYNWIMLYNNPNTEGREVGSKVVRAFYLGYKLIREDYDLICKLDADLTLPDNYFEKVITEFESNNKLGLCGGYCKVKTNWNWIKEKTASYHVRGAIKTYRKAAFLDIGGLDEVLGWDGLDEMKLLFNGWDIYSVDIAVLHHRVTGNESDQKQLYFNLGEAYYKIGYNLTLLLARSLFIGLRKKRILPSIMVLRGFFNAKKNRYEKYVDKDLEKFIRKFQYTRILKLKI